MKTHHYRERTDFRLRTSPPHGNAQYVSRSSPLISSGKSISTAKSGGRIVSNSSTTRQGMRPGGTLENSPSALALGTLQEEFRAPLRDARILQPARVRENETKTSTLGLLR